MLSGRISPLLLLLLSLLIAATASGAPFQCVVQPAASPSIRAEGITELAGDVLLTCTGGVTPAAGAVPVVDVKLSFQPQVPVMSRVLDAATQATEAFALIGEPTPVKQLLCATPANPGACGTANVFPGILTGPGELTWSLPLKAPGDQGQLTIRLTNLRLNASLLAQTPVYANVTFSGAGAPANASQAGALVAGSTLTSLARVVQAAADPALTCSTGTINVRLTEGFASAWRRRTVALPTSATAPPPGAQSIIGFPNDSESGFYNPQFAGVYKPAGLADHGTRIYIRFTDVPAGVKLYTPATVTFPGVSNLVFGSARRITTDAAGAGAYLGATGDSRGLVQMVSQNNGWQAVYEVLNADVSVVNSVDIPVTVTYTGAPVALKAMRVDIGYAPMSTAVSTPRFNFPAGAPQPIPGIDACSSSSSSSTSGGGGGSGGTSTGGASATSAGLYFVPVKPCRVVDTRSDAAGRFGTPALAGAILRSFALPQTTCRLPADARAYSLNFTVVPKGPLGYITTWASGAPQPFASTLNAIDGRIKANAAIVPAGAGAAAITVMATDATELVVDVNGYFVDAAANPRALAFYALPPCRIADTRSANGANGGPVIPAGGSRSFAVLGANCGVPANAEAYSLNATVVPKGPLGYLTLWPTGDEQPVVSTLNSPKGEIVANAAIVPAGTNGAVSAFAQGETHLVLDINGYFAPAGAAGAMKYYTVNPCRIADTRSAGASRVASNEKRDFDPLSAGCGLAGNAAAYAMNVTVVPPGGLGYLTLWPAGSPQPFVSTLNVITDPVVANAALVPAGSNGGISVYATDPVHVVLDVNGFFAP